VDLTRQVILVHSSFGAAIDFIPFRQYALLIIRMRTWDFFGFPNDPALKRFFDVLARAFDVRAPWANEIHRTTAVLKWIQATIHG